MYKRSKERPSSPLAAFERGFVTHIVGCHPVDQIVYGKRVKDYAVGVAGDYWVASQEDGRSHEQCANDDMSYWAADHSDRE
jgi:hypothetical protein